jgi:hypothetical protein
LEKEGNFFRMVVAIGINSEDNFTPGVFEPFAEGVSFPTIIVIMNNNYAFLAADMERVISGSIINNDNFVREVHFLEGLLGAVKEGTDGFFFVEGRHDYRNFWGRQTIRRGEKELDGTHRKFRGGRKQSIWFFNVKLLYDHVSPF